MQPLEVSNVTGNIYLATGGAGANTGFYVGKEGILAVDSKMTKDASSQMLADMKTASDMPVKYMIITHSDLDHVNGLDAFPSGMTIISHENVKLDMEKAFSDPALASLRPYIPKTTYKDEIEMDFEGKKIKLIHFGPGHTSGDTVVLFREERTAFIGDLFFLDREPIVHLAKKGSTFGLINNLKSILALEADRFISGHSRIVSKIEIEALMERLIERKVKVQTMLADGRTIEDIKTEFRVAEIPVPPGRQRFPSFVEVMAMEITGK